MQFLKYKLLSQLVDTTDVYQNLSLLSEVFTIGSSYMIFLKKKTTNETFMVKETFAGGFEVTRIPMHTWGITIDRWVLMKCYDFKKIGVQLLTFKVNSSQYLTIIETDAGQTAVFVDSTSDQKAVNFIESACPFITTSSGKTQTIYSFNQKNDGTNSSVLYDVSIAQNDQTSALTPIKIDSILVTNEFQKQTFTLLISDTASTNLAWSYAITGGLASTYISNQATLQSLLLNQIKSGDSTSLTKVLNASTLDTFINNGLSSDSVLAFCSNTSLIFVDATENYIYKNLLKYYTSTDFSQVPAFQTSDLKFNLFKQILFSFSDVTDVKNIVMSRLILDSNMFMKSESNLSVVETVLHKESGLQLADAQSMWEILTPSDVAMTSSIIPTNMIQD